MLTAFFKNVSFKNYAAICPWRVLVGHSCLSSRVWDPGSTESAAQSTADHTLLRLLVGDETNEYGHEQPG